jgi:hypothetical protein
MSEIEAILSDWDEVTVQQVGPLVVIGGRYQGQQHAGARADGESLARDLDAIAKRGAVFGPVTVEPEPERAPVEAEPEPAPPPLSFEQLAGAGVMLIEDELQIRRGLATAQIGDYADVLIANAVDPSRRQSIAAEMAAIWNKRQLGIELEAHEAETEAWHEALTQWEGKVRAFERSLRDAVRNSGLDMLRDFDVANAGWPK